MVFISKAEKKRIDDTFSLYVSIWSWLFCLFSPDGIKYCKSILRKKYGFVSNFDLFMLLFLYSLKSVSYKDYLSAPFSYIFKNLDKIYKNGRKSFSLNKKNRKQRQMKKNRDRKKGKNKSKNLSINARIKKLKSIDYGADKESLAKNSSIIRHLVDKKKKISNRKKKSPSYFSRLDKRLKVSDGVSIFRRFYWSDSTVLTLDKCGLLCRTDNGECIGALGNFLGCIKEIKDRYDNPASFENRMRELGIYEEYISVKNSFYNTSGSDSDSSLSTSTSDSSGYKPF